MRKQKRKAKTSPNNEGDQSYLILDIDFSNSFPLLNETIFFSFNLHSNNYLLCVFLIHELNDLEILNVLNLFHLKSLNFEPYHDIMIPI